MESKQTIAVKIISPAATLKSIPVGETRVIRSRDIKENVVRSTASRLAKKHGYKFITDECPEGISVKRTQ